MNSNFFLLSESHSFSLTWQCNNQLTVQYQYGRRHKRNCIDLAYRRKSLSSERENGVWTEVPHHWVTCAPFASQVTTELFGYCTQTATHPHTHTPPPPLPHPLPNNRQNQHFCSVWSRSRWPRSYNSLFLFALRSMKNSVCFSAKQILL